jgi:hypothetical protein
MHAALPVMLPRPLTETELDEAELGVRVALSQLHADTGEQILLSRSAKGIEIKGIVETNERRAELVTRLLQLPHASPSLLSVEELGSQPKLDGSPESAPVETDSVEGRPSPLEQYLREKKLPLDQVESLSQNLFEQSVKVQQAEVRLLELHQRFKAANQLPADQKQQLTQLSEGYIHVIEAALDANARALQAIGLDGPEHTASHTTDEDIDHQVLRYQELCQQLVTSRTGEPLSAALVATEIRNASALIRSGANQIHTAVSIAHN